MKICVDPGHGVGASGGTPGEHELVLEYARHLRSMLVHRGHEVMMTRTGAQDVSFSRRVQIANDFDARCFISLHMNGSSNAAANGLWVLHAGSREGRRLATDLFTHLRRIPNLEDDDPEAEVYPDGTGWTGDRTLYVLQNTRMPAALIELGFLTNRLDRQQLEDPATVQPVCQAITRGIEEWAGVEPAPVEPTDPHVVGGDVEQLYDPTHRRLDLPELLQLSVREASQAGGTVENLTRYVVDRLVEEGREQVEDAKRDFSDLAGELVREGVDYLIKKALGRL